MQRLSNTCVIYTRPPLYAPRNTNSKFKKGLQRPQLSKYQKGQSSAQTENHHTQFYWNKPQNKYLDKYSGTVSTGSFATARNLQVATQEIELNPCSNHSPQRNSTHNKLPYDTATLLEGAAIDYYCKRTVQSEKVNEIIYTK